MEALVEPRLALTSRPPDSVVAWQGGRAVTFAELLGDAQRLRQRLPAGGVLANLCRDRYAFLVGFLACRLANRVCLLPGDRSAHRAAGLRDSYRDAHALVDDATGAEGWPSISVETLTGERAAAELAAGHDQPSTIALTSGSTGDPVAHTRTWGSQALQIDALADRLGLARAETTSVIATVPFGHMYGFELTILMPLRANVAIDANTPLFADDIRRALDAVPAPRVLVTSPFHLRALAGYAPPLPPIARIISATAPLGAALARRIEARFATEVYEIYGCTEAGSVATRRTVDGARWQPVDGMRFSAAARAPDAPPLFQVEVPARRAPIPLADVLALDATVCDSTGGFELLGRIGDMIKVGGKRGSLSELTAALLAVDGVVDGAMVMPETRGEAPEATPDRPVALAVAPGLSAGDVLKGLRARLDPAFVPRRAILLDALPRDAVGKLSRADIDAVLAAAGASAPVVVPLTFDADHPSLAGHFPGRPLIPGVVLLDGVARQARATFGLGVLDGIAQAKFQRTVPPGAETMASLRRLAPTRVAYEVRIAGELVASGELSFRIEAMRPDA